jgi:hypothetical protein
MIAHPRTLRLVLVLALLLPMSTLAAGLTCAKPADSTLERRLEEPEEVASNASETVTSQKAMLAWLRRLVGRYTLDGYIDPCGSGYIREQRAVTGKADCIATSVTPDVHCKFNLSWPAAGKGSGATTPDNVSDIAPAQLLFSIEVPLVIKTPFGTLIPPNYYGDGANHSGIVLVQVDNKDVGEYASGVLVNDTFLSTEPCMDKPGDCHRITRVTIKSEPGEIFMTVEVRTDGQRVTRQVFTLHRKPDLRKTE